MASMDGVYETLKKHSKEIEQQAEDGNDRALTIIRLYKMHVDCPNDPGAQGILMGVVDDWKVANGVN